MRGVVVSAVLACMQPDTPTPIRESRYFSINGAVEVIQDGQSLWGRPCVMPVSGVAEAGFAFSSVVVALSEFGFVSGTRETLEDLGFLSPDGHIQLCYMNGGLGFAGLTDGRSAWVSMVDNANNHIPIYETALVHEFVHHLIGRLCLAEDKNGCTQDPGHAAIGMWGNASVEARAQEIWQCGRY